MQDKNLEDYVYLSRDLKTVIKNKVTKEYIPYRLENQSVCRGRRY